MIRLNREGGQRKFAQYDLACIYAVKGDKEKAFRYLEEYGNRKYSRPFEISLLKKIRCLIISARMSGFSQLWRK